MMTKKFTVTFTSDESTRWIQDDNFLALQLQFVARSVGKSITTGNEPSVEAFKDDSQPELFREPAMLPPR